MTRHKSACEVSHVKLFPCSMLWSEEWVWCQLRAIPNGCHGMWAVEFFFGVCSKKYFLSWSAQEDAGSCPFALDVYMFAVDLKYRCIHYVSEHSRFSASPFKLFSPLNIADLPQIQRQMSNSHTYLRAGFCFFSLSWLHGRCQIWKCFYLLLETYSQDV